MYPEITFELPDIRIMAMHAKKDAHAPHFIRDLLENADDVSKRWPRFPTACFFEGDYEGRHVEVVTYLHLDPDDFQRALFPARATLQLYPDYPSKDRYIEVLVDQLEGGQNVVTMKVVAVVGEFEPAYLEIFLKHYAYALQAVVQR